LQHLDGIAQGTRPIRHALLQLIASVAQRFLGALPFEDFRLQGDIGGIDLGGPLDDLAFKRGWSV